MIWYPIFYGEKLLQLGKDDHDCNKFQVMQVKENSLRFQNTWSTGKGLTSSSKQYQHSPLNPLFITFPGYWVTYFADLNLNCAANHWTEIGSRFEETGWSFHQVGGSGCIVDWPNPDFNPSRVGDPDQPSL